MNSKIIFLEDYREQSTEPLIEDEPETLDWWHVFTFLTFLLCIPFLIYVMTVLMMEIGTLLGVLYYLLR